MYLGIYSSQVRAKNRLSFPARFRKQTGDILYLTNWFENSILVLPKNEWEQLTSNIFESASFMLPEVRDLDRFIFGGTFQIELDKEGRFVVPSYLKDYAELKKNAVFVGGMWYMQLWDEDVFENYRQINALQIKEKATKIFTQIKHEK